MDDFRLTRRRAFVAGLGWSVAAAAGCGSGDAGPSEAPRSATEADEVATAPAPAPAPAPATVPAPALGWEVIASGGAGPGPRSRHGLVYDRAAKAAVLFGGVIWGGRASLPADTWELHGRRWSRIATPKPPPGRHRGAMTYLDGRGQSLLFGGQGASNELLGDAWTYSARRWRQLRPVGDRPAPRCGHGLAYDEQAGVAVLFGGIDADDRALGDTWVLAGDSWKQIGGASPPARRYAAFAYDPKLKGCLLHGGAEDDASRHQYGDAWLFREDAWTPLGAEFKTDTRDDHGLGYHRSAGRSVLLEGLSGGRGLLVQDEAGWRAVEADPLHPRHQCSPLAWDEELGGLLMHGGEAAHGGPQFDATLLLRMPPAA